jgi:small subunit ribosomal protein S1
MRQGGMEGEASLRQVMPDNVDWWTSLDEGYWLALTEQGEIVSVTAPPADPQEIFYTLGLEAASDIHLAQVPSDGGNGPDLENEWISAQGALERGEMFCLKVSGANRGGVLLEWNGLQGFVPASHLSEMPRSQDPQERVSELSQRIGDSLDVCLIEVDPQQNRLVFSERVAASGSRSPSEILNTLRIGDIRRGLVTNLTSFGAFVDLGGVEGLVHISELSWDRVRHPSDVVHPSQQVEVYVLGVNPEQKRIALSLKRLHPNPWAEAEARYRPGELIEGVVTNVVDFGAFVRVEEGVEGLIHVSELAEGSFLHPRNVVREGDVIRVRVLNVDSVHHRLGLSLRQAHRPEGSTS